MPSPSPRAARISSLRVHEGSGFRVALRGRGSPSTQGAVCRVLYAQERGLLLCHPRWHDDPLPLMLPGSLTPSL